MMPREYCLLLILLVLGTISILWCLVAKEK
jgi:hypothetical protein